ncbi:MAG: chromosome segregation protein SMC [Planctomycetota bacterium]
MLEALELNGFKSFAEKTVFRFDAGITGVVGPNGSGKSNVVDAIKWVLGSQSAKGLRGKEMTDVIFGGSGGRAPANAAEVTMVYDNRGGALPVETPKVRVTRRVYRSGEGEYLLNGEPSRLRTIRDLFAGTGVSTGAYSIIEQGRVDALLQSSPRERRMLFEEAAGISRFKTKRQEADRRMERVKRDLARLRDTVGSLESRLKTVRSQAGKAKTYRELTQRLRTARATAGAADRAKLLRAVAALTDQRDDVTAYHDEAKAETLRLRALLSELEKESRRLQSSIDAAKSRDAETGAELAAAGSTRQAWFERLRELETTEQRLRSESASQTAKLAGLERAETAAAAELSSADERYHTLKDREGAHEREAEAAERQAEEYRLELGALHELSARKAAESETLFARFHTLREQVTALAADLVSRRDQSQRAAADLEDAEGTASEADRKRQVLDKRHAELAAQWAQLDEQLRQGRADAAAAQQEAESLKSEAADAEQRLAVLEALELRMDGLNDAAKDLLKAAEGGDNPAGVVGMVADLLRVDADMAPLVELALGDAANHLVVESGRSLPTLNGGAGLKGRVSLLRLDVSQAPSVVDRLDLSAEAGVVGRADAFVQTPQELASLGKRLLGRWWIVDSLETALRLADGVGRGLNYATVAGEIVREDGGVVLGPRGQQGGVLSRRGELRELRELCRSMGEERSRLAALSKSLGQSIRQWEHEQQTAQTGSSALDSQRADAGVRFATAEARLRQAKADAAEAERALQDLQEQRLSAEAEEAALAALLEEAKREASEANARIEQVESELPELTARAEELRAGLTASRVELARLDQLRTGVRARVEHLSAERGERTGSVSECQARVDEASRLRSQLLTDLLSQGQRIAGLFSAQEAGQRELKSLAEEAASANQAHSAAVEIVEEQRQRYEECRRRLQAIEMNLQQQNNSLAALVKGLRDEHQIAPEELDNHPEPVSESGRAALEEEINTLRERLQSIGPVNVEALSELDELEDRHNELASKLQDLAEAETKLRRLIQRINVDSRKVFSETIETARGHFRELFSTLFGGGEADILVETDEEQDVLECGIEIVAKPPGKRPRSISLLSGGERTMTCVALLLAIFRSRPSPFCILDEVDAALDEANIDRFVGVLREFMASTQFIVVTHSKRTMSCADTLYGVTMAESGISKRVSVRFAEETGGAADRHAA